MLTDTHTHLYLPEFDADNLGVDAVNRAIEAGVERMIFPNVDLGTIEPMKRLHSLFPDNTRMAMGFHPTEVNDGWADSLDVVRRELDSAPGAYVAVGEIGIDLYWDKTFEREQMLAFEQQVGWAVERGLPVIVHCREGLDRVLEVLQEFPSARGVMHSFGGEAADVDRVKRTVDFYFGINGIVTRFPPSAPTGCCSKPIRLIWPRCPTAAGATKALSLSVWLRTWPDLLA